MTAGTPHYQTGRDRAARLGAGVQHFRPPENMIGTRAWHQVDTHMGRRRVQWRPGIEVWHGDIGERWTSEAAHALNWTYVSLSLDQSGGVP